MALQMSDAALPMISDAWPTSARASPGARSRRRISGSATSGPCTLRRTGRGRCTKPGGNWYSAVKWCRRSPGWTTPKDKDVQFVKTHWNNFAKAYRTRSGVIKGVPEAMVDHLIA